MEAPIVDIGRLVERKAGCVSGRGCISLQVEFLLSGSKSDWPLIFFLFFFQECVRLSQLQVPGCLNISFS